MRPRFAVNTCFERRERSRTEDTIIDGGPLENRPSNIENSSRGPQPLTVTIRESGSSPRPATALLTPNPFTNDVLQRETPVDISPGRRLRRWTHFLHTGEALGVPRQLATGLARPGSCFLIYTGFTRSYRRFFGQPKTSAPAT